MYDNNLHILIVTLFMDYYKVFSGVYLAVTSPVHIVMVPFVHVWMVHTDLEMVFSTYKPGSF